MIKGLLAAMFMAAPFAMSAADVEIDGIMYTLNSSQKKCTAVGLAEGSTTENLVIPAEVTYDGTTYAVTSVGAFNDCVTLKSVTIPGSVTELQNNLFSGCTSLTEMTLEPASTTLTLSYVSPGITTVNAGRNIIIGYGSPTEFIRQTISKIVFFGDKVQNFTGPIRDCKNLEEVVISPSIVSIQSYAFRDCEIANLVFEEGNKLLQIKEYDSSEPAFFGCTIKNLKLGRPFKNINAFANMTIDGVTESVEIGAYAKDYTFANTTVKTVVFDEGVTEIEEKVFEGCTSLKDVSIAGSVTKMYLNAFDGCKLTSLSFEDSEDPIEIRSSTGLEYQNMYIGRPISDAYLTSFTNFTKDASVKIGKYATVYSVKSPNIISVEIEDGSTVVPNNALNSSSITSVSLPSTIISIGKSAFGSCPSLTSIELPEGLETIGNSAFSNCQSLTSIELPASVKTIGDQAFYQCGSLASIELPEGLQSLGSSVFYECYKLEKVNIPEAITTLKGQTFGRSGLRELISWPVNPPAVESYTQTFPTYWYNGNGTVYVQNGSVDAYRADKFWKQFNIVGMDSAIDEVEAADAAEAAEVYTVYSLSGVKLLDAASADAFNALPAGLYIVNGRKHLLRK